jgi:branched-chain amino acid aminotransferase
MDGILVPLKEAAVPFLTAGLHYGIGVFEGIRYYGTALGPAVFRLKDHVERLFASAHILGFMRIPFGPEELTQAIKETVAANGFAQGYIRPLIYLAQGGWNLSVVDGQTRVGIAVWEWDEFWGREAQERGLRANISSFARHHPNVSMTKAKIAGNYVNSAMAKNESVRLGFDEAIMLDPQGYVAECTGENIFLVKNGNLYAPSIGATLEGITRDTVMWLAREVGLELLEQPISRDQLYVADEVFVCGTASEVVALREIDFRVIGDGRPGPVTNMLHNAFKNLTRGRHSLSAQWLDYLENSGLPP